MQERPDGTVLRLDLRGLKCPLPALRTRKALVGLQAGDVLIVEATDPLSGIDIPHCVRETGHKLKSHAVENGVAIFTIEIQKTYA